MENFKTTVEESNELPSINKTYKTRELNWWQKTLQVYWVNPKSWLLDEFTIKDTTITVKVKNGKIISAPVDKVKIKIQSDKSGRREVYLSYNDEKLHFKEIPWMLTDDEWEEVFEIFTITSDTKLAKAAWAMTIASKLIEFMG